MDFQPQNQFQKNNFQGKFNTRPQNKKNFSNYSRPQATNKPYKMPLNNVLQQQQKNMPYRQPNQNSNSWKQQRREQPNHQQGKNFFDKNFEQPVNGVQMYWDQNALEFKTFNYYQTDQNTPPAEIVGFKIVLNGQVVHDEMLKPDEGNKETSTIDFQEKYDPNGPGAHKYNDLPEFEEISLPSFIEA